MSQAVKAKKKTCSMLTDHPGKALLLFAFPMILGLSLIHI